MGGASPRASRRHADSEAARCGREPRPAAAAGAAPVRGRSGEGSRGAATPLRSWRNDRPTVASPEHRDVDSLDGFGAFREPGWTKVLTDFELATADGSTMIRTQTRGRSTSAASRRRFAAYWTLIRPGSALVRRELLAAIDRLAVASM